LDELFCILFEYWMNNLKIQKAFLQ
jgi:hypothetical protein